MLQITFKLSIATLAAAMLQSVAVADEFYAGKTVTIVSGHQPGSSYDTNARFVARHLPRFLPGNPTVIVRNMPGAGTLSAANHVANVAPKLCADLMACALKGDYAGALKIQDRLVPLHDAIFKEPGLAGAKHGLKRLGRIEEEVRLPLIPVTPATGEVIRSAMVHAGLLNA